MTWKQRHADALRHFGLDEGDIIETMRVHKGSAHVVYPVYRCFRCGLNFSGVDCERVKMKQGRIVVVMDEVQHK